MYWHFKKKKNKNDKIYFIGKNTATVSLNKIIKIAEKIRKKSILLFHNFDMKYIILIK